MNLKSGEQQGLAELALQWAQIIEISERPAPFSSRDGFLRLVAANEKLSYHKSYESLLQLLQQRSYLVAEFKHLLLKCCCCHLKPDQQRASGKKVPRYAAAWCRGWLYLQAGNNIQALRDAETALAYSATAAVIESVKPTLLATQPVCEASLQSLSKTCVPPLPVCSWFPALLLAGECFMALESWPQAVLHFAKAVVHANGSETTTEATAAATSLMSKAVCQLNPEQAWAFKAGGVQSLHQQLQDEAEMKLPEVLRPRPKWYYYNKWMTQRIHTALLDLHLPAVAARTSLSLLCSHHGQGNDVQGAAPFSLPAGDPQQLMAAADALLGPNSEAVLAAAATAAGLQTNSNPDNGCSKSSPVMSGASQQLQPQQLYELPRPVLEKLLSLDAGDLDLMIQHPRALQGQVYELLDVWRVAGADGLEQLEVPHLSWSEVQALTGSQRLVGLPLGYRPPPEGTLLRTPAIGCATAGVIEDTTQLLQLKGPLAAQAQGLAVDGNRSRAAISQPSASRDLDLHAASPGAPSAAMDAGWHRPGWTRAQYLLA